MPEHLNQPEVEVIIENSVIDIQVSTFFASRLRDLAFNMTQGKTETEMAEAHRQISEDKVTDPWIKDWETVLMLVREVDQQAQQQGKTRKVVIDLTDLPEESR